MRIEMVVGQNLAKQRLLCGKSQSDLGVAIAQTAGKAWSRQTISAAEKGDRAFTVRDLVMLARVLRVPVTTLLLPPAGDEGEQVEVGDGTTISRDQMTNAVCGNDDALFRARMSPVIQSMKQVLGEMQATAQNYQWVVIDALNASEGDDMRDLAGVLGRPHPADQPDGQSEQS